MVVSGSPQRGLVGSLAFLNRFVELAMEIKHTQCMSHPKPRNIFYEQRGPRLVLLSIKTLKLEQAMCPRALDNGAGHRFRFTSKPWPERENMMFKGWPALYWTQSYLLD